MISSANDDGKDITILETALDAVYRTIVSYINNRPKLGLLYQITRQEESQ